jgi:hypothetical protein
LSLRIALLAEILCLRSALRHEVVGLCLALLGCVVCFSVSQASKRSGFGISLFTELLSLCRLFLRVQLGIGFLLATLLLDLRLHDFGRAKPLEFHERALLLNVGVEFCIPSLGFALCVDAREVQVVSDLDLLVCEFGVGGGFLGFALCFEDGGCGVDFGHFLLRLALLLGFTDLATHAGIGDVDFGLVERAFVRFAR